MNEWQKLIIEMTETLARIEESQKRTEADIAEHIKRTNILQDQVEVHTKYFERAFGAAALVTFLMTVASIVYKFSH